MPLTDTLSPSSDRAIASLALPTRSRGRQTAEAARQYEQVLGDWCAGLIEIKARLDFTPGTRGWCYLLEQEHGLPKGDFSKAEKLIGDCRKRGLLPLNFCATDAARSWKGVEDIDDSSPEDKAESLLDEVRWAHHWWTPFSFWDEQPVFLMLLVEKVDLLGLFASICNEYRIPRANAKGVWDIHQRAAMMQTFKRMEAAGKQCVLLYGGDFDPHGLLISEYMHKNLVEMSQHPDIDWSPKRLIIDRFALTREFIDEQNLPWIDGLESGSGNDLSTSDVRHINRYIRDHGKRKVESNALVVRPEAGRQLLRDTIAQYLPVDAPRRHEQSLADAREDLRQAVARRLDGWDQ